MVSSVEGHVIHYDVSEMVAILGRDQGRLRPCGHAASSGARALGIVVSCCVLLSVVAPQPLLAAADRDESVSGKKTSPKARAKSSSGEATGVGADAVKPAYATPTSAARFDIDEYRVEGADSLPQIDVEAAVYPFLGPGRTADDIEKARVALEKSYHDRGLQTVAVSVPQQDPQRGFVVLHVVENRVGRLRVKGSRYFDVAKIKNSAPSLKEGALPNFDAVTKDITSLNQWPDRRVTPALRAGVTPGTVDVDLNVEDTYPLHGSLELNNRQSPSTTALRASAAMHYDNLWQRGDSFNLTYQEAPLNPKDAMVVSASYLARTDYDWLNVLVYGLKSWSSVATVGGANVIGPGQVIGARAVLTLPSKGELVQTLSLGADYKNFWQTLSLGSGSFDSPINYVPLVASYGASWKGDGRLTQLSATVTAGTRGIGSDKDQFDAKRFKATASFIRLNADISHTQDLPGDAQLFTRVQGQIADQPLVSSEQLSLGGQDTVRGYLESEVLGDYGASGTLELRTPNLAPHFEQNLENPLGAAIKFNAFNEWRFYAFADVGRAEIFDPLIDQQSRFDLASYGIGTQMKTLNHFNGVFFVAMPLISQEYTVANHPRFSFRLWGEF
jgi:hemolysin activation/secretion protein